MKNTTYIRKNISAITFTITAVLMLTQLPLINQTRAVCNPPDGDNYGISLSLLDGSNPAAKGTELKFEAVPDNTDYAGEFTWTIPVTNEYDEKDTNVKESTKTVTAENVGEEQTVKVHFDPNDPVTGSADATMDMKVVEMASLKAEDNSGSGNSAETTEPTDPKTLYIPYTEDDSGYSTTDITITAAPEPDGDFPEEYPEWGLNGPSGAAGLPDNPGKEFTYTIDAPGSYKFTAKCGNELTVEVIVFKIQMDVKRIENTDGSRKYVAATLDDPWFMFSEADREVKIGFSVTPSESVEGEYGYQIGILEDPRYTQGLGEIKASTFGDGNYGEVKYVGLPEQKADLQPIQGPDMDTMSVQVAAFKDGGRQASNIISVNEVSTQVANYSTFQYIVNEKGDYEEAIDFILWKYDWIDITPIGTRADLRYGGVDNKYGNSYRIGLWIEIYKPAFTSENICASVIIHELNHIENHTLTGVGPEEDAYRCEYENAYRTGVEKNWIDDNWDYQEGGDRPDSTYNGYSDND